MHFPEVIEPRRFVRRTLKDLFASLASVKDHKFIHKM
jgi:hypothetical protein